MKKNIILLLGLSLLFLFSSFAKGASTRNQPNYNQSKDLQSKEANFIHQTNGKITLNFQNISIRAALKVLAEFSGVNLVVSDSVKGNITLNLKNISWEQTLDIILRMQGLDKEKFDNVWLIAPINEIAAHEKQILSAQQQLTKLEPLRSILMQINYANARDIADLLRNQRNSLLSDKGTVSVDTRTNTLWLQDTPERLKELNEFIKRLDVPVKQVLIAARIVVIDKNYEQELGIQWQTGEHMDATQFLSSAKQSATTQPLKVDLPIAALGFPGGTSGMAIVLAKLTNDVLLDMELSALESENFAKIIANPRIITANQQEAKIETGEEIPYQEATESGGTAVSFKKAVLSLNVKPQITPDNRIILTLRITQDSKGANSVSGVPSINTREIQTRVLINNAQTLVLGGIYEINDSNSIHRVPWLGSLPLIGELFKHTATQRKQTELLVFITPKIIKQPV